MPALDTFFELEGASFCCTVADRQNGDLAKNYRSSWQIGKLKAVNRV